MPDQTALKRATLVNGLEVILYPSFDAPVASFWVWYRVGSRNELPGITGVSHWVEHMMFKGTESVGPGELMLRVNQNGGEINAFTSYDFTAYHETLPADRIDMAVELEADRMANLLIDTEETESERTVILSERQGAFNNPSYVLWDETIASAFRAHSYRHFVIGNEYDLKTMSRDDLFRYYRRWYSPDNAVVVVTGAFDADEMMRRVETHFGPIPAGDRARPVPVAEPEQLGERRVVLRQPAPAPEVLTGYHVPGAGSDDSQALEVLAAVLSGAGGRMGKSSRLPRSLVATGKARSASANYLKGIDPFLFLVGATGLPDGEVETLDRLLREQLDQVRQSAISAAELDKAKKQLTSVFHYGTESVTEQGNGIGEAAMYGDASDFFTYPERIAAVSTDDILRVAQTYLTDSKRTVGYMIPTEPSTGGDQPTLAALRFGLGGVGAPGLQPFEQMELVPNATLLTQPQPNDPVVSARIRIKMGSADDPDDKHGLSHLTGQMLLRGNARRTREEFEEACDDLGASIGVTSGRENTEITVTCLATDLDSCLDLVGEALAEPAFDPKQLELTRREAHAAIRHAQDNTMSVADQAARELLYPAGHPLRHRAVGEPEGLNAVTVDDLRDFHSTRALQDSLTAAVVGGFADTASLAERLRSALRLSARAGSERPNLDASIPSAPAQTAVVVPGKAQADIAMFSPVPGARKPEFHALEVADVVLGQLGMMGRIGERVRQKQGLAYYAFSSILPGKTQSLWFSRAGVDPSDVGRASESVRAVLREVIESGISDEELAGSVQLMTGRLALTMQTNAGIAALLQTIAELDLGLDYVERYPTLLAAITRESARQALADAVNPDALLTAVAGPA